jgi:hypothetical protein
MTFLPDELNIDETVDTKAMSPEDDFAPVDSPAVPRKGNEPSRDLEASQFNQSNVPDAFEQPVGDQFPSQEKEMPEFVGSDDPLASAGEALSGPPVTPGEGEEQEFEFAPELLNAAGLTEEQARSDFGTPEAVQAAVRMLDTRFVNDGRQETGAVEPPPTDDIIVEPSPFELPPREDGEEWDPDSVKLIEAMNQRTEQLLAQRDAQIKQQQEYVQNLATQQQQADAARQLEEFDDMVNSLPDDWNGLLGKGTAYDLEPRGLHFNNRMHLEQTMNALQNGNIRSGRQPIPSDELMVRALSVAFPEQQQAVVRREVVQEVAQRQQVMTARPTQRREAAVSPVQKAGQTAEEWYRKHNMSTEYDYDETL